MFESLIVCAKIIVFPQGKCEEGPFDVVIERGLISAIDRCKGECGNDKLTCHYLTPGFIDIHNHGMGGADDVTEFWCNPDFTRSRLIQYGTTSFLASVVFPDHPLGEKEDKILKILESHVGLIDGNGAVLEGIHSEGPIITDLGAMPQSYNNMTSDEFEQLLDKMPHLKVMTISPHAEASHNYNRIKCLLRREVVPALGHDKQATEEEILTALSLSKSQQLHLTHLFNVCSFHHRSPGLVNFGLLDELPNLSKYRGIKTPTVEIIGDLAHVDPIAVSLLLKARHFKNIAFITDCVLEGIPRKTVKYGSKQIQVSPSGRTLSIAGTNTLAGSCGTLLGAFHSLIHIFRVPLGDAVAMLSENPARIAKISHTGLIEVGKRADLLLFDTQLNLSRTIVSGKVVFQTN
ncbi:N-acetylglucosamine-6-phosphate deacetylase isoform X1 [Pocillopora verrucosa]|uniref:N-acetylglucosamine-6-phosphate deacetylase isoform X1 n=1 Tax=Pocillopora verrucosa TaxID=203993 RepID=UPI00333EC9CA